LLSIMNRTRFRMVQFFLPKRGLPQLGGCGAQDSQIVSGYHKNVLHGTYYLSIIESE
jgi:hypothetical protein